MIDTDPEQLVNDSVELRGALGRFATGVTIVTTCTDNGRRTHAAWRLRTTAVKR